MRKEIKKLIYVVGIICLVNLCFVGYMIYHLYQSEKKYDLILNQGVQKEELVYKLGENMYRMQSMMLAYVLSDDNDVMIRYEKILDEIDEKNVKDFKTLEELMVTVKEKDMYHNLYSGYVTYQGQREMIELLVEQHSRETAKYYVNAVMQKHLEKMDTDMKQLGDYVDGKIGDSKSSLYKHQFVTKVILEIIAVISMMGLVVLFLFLIKFSRSIVDTFTLEQAYHREHVIRMQRKTIENMAELVESRDGETGTHIKNTAKYVKMIAKTMAKQEKYAKILNEEYIELLARFAPLHDVGKITVPDSILLKPGKLTDEEFKIMQSHTVNGGNIIIQILTDIESEENVMLARDIALCHHEKWNGTGYPSGLAGEEIPLCARIMAVADVFDALISKRCYKKSMSIDEAFGIIEKDMGSHFDPDVAETFLGLREEIENYINR